MIPGAATAANRPRRLRLPDVHPVLKLGTLALGVASCLAAPFPLLAVLAALVLLGLARSGLPFGGQLRALRPWLPMAVFILAVHVLTTTAAAPLGHPSWAGAQAGLTALLRVAASVGCLALYGRAASLDEIVAAVRWWLQPAERLGFPGEDLGLVLAVALGTAPLVAGEGRRIETAVRLRRSGPVVGPGTGRFGRSVRRWWTRQLDRARVAVPLVETLARRAETLSLSLRSRRPVSGGTRWGPPPWPGLVLLLAWLVLLIWLGPLGTAVLDRGGAS